MGRDRLPDTEFEVNEEVSERLRRKFYELQRKYGRETVEALYPWANYAEDQLNRVGGEAAIQELYKDSTDIV